jgi:hypothetical protein
MSWHGQPDDSIRPIVQGLTPGIYHHRKRIASSVIDIFLAKDGKKGRLSSTAQIE